MASVRRVTTVGIVSAGAMGSAVGAAYRSGGARVVTTLQGRSGRTAGLATAAGLEVLDDLDAVVAAADVLLSVVPPGRALETAQALAAAAQRTGASPLLVDANAVSPATVRQVAAVGLEVVDGSISGVPPSADDTRRTRLYLSGPRAQEVAELPAPWLDVRVVGPEVGTASAVKMCTASYYKGEKALIAQALLTADAHGVSQVVLDDLGARSGDARSVGLAGSKGWRFVDEMREIAATQSAAGLPPELFEGVARAYEELAARTRTPAPEDVPGDLDGPALLDQLRR